MVQGNPALALGEAKWVTGDGSCGPSGDYFLSISFSLVFMKDHSPFEGFDVQHTFFIAVLLPDFPL